MKPVVEKVVRVGRNRGKARLWLEGRWLADLGFVRGTKFAAVFTPNVIALHVKEPDYDIGRTVSGKGDKPIIDIAGARLEPWAGSDLALVGRPGIITIRRA